jgi:hypothetical protein
MKQELIGDKIFMFIMGFYCHYRHYQRLELKTNEER